MFPKDSYRYLNKSKVSDREENEKKINEYTE